MARSGSGLLVLIALAGAACGVRDGPVLQPSPDPAAVTATALGLLGRPYAFGGATPDGFRADPLGTTYWRQHYLGARRVVASQAGWDGRVARHRPRRVGAGRDRVVPTQASALEFGRRACVSGPRPVDGTTDIQIPDGLATRSASAREAQGTRSGRTDRGRRPRGGVDPGMAPADPASGRLVAEERLRARQGSAREPPPALAVAHRTGGHVPGLARHGPPLPGGTGPVEPARGGRRRRRPAAVGPRPPPAAGRRVLRGPGDGHRRRRVRQDPDDGGAGGLRRPPPRHAARDGRLHHLHEQGHRGDPATDARTPAGPPGGHRSTSSRAGC